MQLNVVEKKEEMLLSRTMIRANLEFDKATPSYAETTSLLASNLKADEKLIAIRHISTSFGDKKAQVTAYLYSDENKKQEIEPKIKKNMEKAAKVAAKK